MKLEKGSGTSFFLHHYDLVDLKVENEIIYYRLKQVDFDGKFNYSKIIALDHRLSSEKKEVARYNVLGQEVSELYKGIIIILYSDGSSVKINN